MCPSSIPEMLAVTTPREQTRLLSWPFLIIYSTHCILPTAWYLCTSLRYRLMLEVTGNDYIHPQIPNK